VVVHTDSELMVRQLSGTYKVKSETIRPLFKHVNELRSQFDSCFVRHVRREKNEDADRLVNQALDARRNVEEKPVPRDHHQASHAAGRHEEARLELFDKAAPKERVRLGILISGGGRTMLNIHDAIQRGELQADIALVISSLSAVAGVGRARNAGLPLQIIRTKDCADIDAFSRKIVEALDAAQVDLVVQGGWLCLWEIPPQYENRVMNIHPALLPCFGGQGMWGHHVHEAVLAAGCKVSGCTVHFCTSEYDKGPIIVQRTCPVQDDDTPDTLADRVFEQECLAYPEAIRLFAEGRLQVEGNRVRISR
jgi:phosphoribosylglycinamide formyltransferase-1